MLVRSFPRLLILLKCLPPRVCKAFNPPGAVWIGYPGRHIFGNFQKSSRGLQVSLSSFVHVRGAQCPGGGEQAFGLYPREFGLHLYEQVLHARKQSRRSGGWRRLHGQIPFSTAAV
jgi:hypothetical protein